MKNIGIIGGTGVYTPNFMQNAKTLNVETPYGKTEVIEGEVKGRGVYFLTRHGKGHTVPPHKVNYRANIYALHLLGTKRIVATAAVGAINKNFAPGTFVILDQFLDFTKSRIETFFSEGKVVHTDCTDPYCPEISLILKEAMEHFGYPYHMGGTYVATEGPRFETRAEIKAYGILGVDVVGMTGIPEIALAKELGMCYASVAVVTNFAAGISGHMLSHGEVVEKMAELNEKVRNILTYTVAKIPDERHCNCAKAPTSGE